MISEMQHQKKKKRVRKIKGQWNMTPEEKKRGRHKYKKKRLKKRRCKIRFHFKAIFCLPRSYRTQKHIKKIFFCTHHQKNSRWIVPKLLKYKHFYFCRYDYFTLHICPYFGGVGYKIICILNCAFCVVFIFGFFRWLTKTSNRNAEPCNRIPSNYCLP